MYEIVRLGGHILILAQITDYWTDSHGCARAFAWINYVRVPVWKVTPSDPYWELELN